MKKNLINIRKTILKHYFNPTKKGFLNKENMLYINKISDSCVDSIFLELKIINNKIINLRFDGVGCILSIASIDILANQLENKNLFVAEEIIFNFINMLYNKPYKINNLYKLRVFINIPNQTNRIKCIMIGIKGVLDLINIYKNKNI